MKIDNLEINADLWQVLVELQKQLVQNGILYLQKIRDSGKDIMVCCPYHKEGQERKPSAGVRKEDGLFHCFTCGETHSLQEVISHCFGKNDAGLFGWQWLIKNFGTVSREERKDVSLDFGRGRDNRSDSNDNSSDSRLVSEQELDKYRYYHKYWTERKITDEHIIELFDLGYDKETKCITFPVRDIKGNCLFVARRSVCKKYFNYPRNVEKPLYGLYEINETFPPFLTDVYGEKPRIHPIEVIVCESMIDALTCWQWGKYAVATNGTQVSELQFRQLRDLSCRMLILAMDNDEAGRKAMQRIRKHIKNKIIKEYVLPEGRKDINELSKEEFENLREIF